MAKTIASSATSIIAIIAISIIMIVALLAGHDGVLLMSSFTIIGGIAGYKIKTLQTATKEKNTVEKGASCEVK